MKRYRDLATALAAFGGLVLLAAPWLTPWPLAGDLGLDGAILLAGAFVAGMASM